MRRNKALDAVDTIDAAPGAPVLRRESRAAIRAVIRFAAAALIAIAVLPAGAQEKRYHGESLDENHRLLIEEELGVCRIGVFERSRFSGDRLIDQTAPSPGTSPRATPAPEFLLEVRAEVLKSSSPNYLQNPGERYRISMKTLRPEPEYENEVEVVAEFARDQLFFEFEQVRERTTGLERKAVETAAPLVAEIFKEEQRLPAEIFTSVLKSRTGQFRITPGTRQRREIAPAQSFAPSMKINRPELGATRRAEARQALPSGAAKPGEVAAPQPEEHAARPVEPGQVQSAGSKPSQ